MKEVILEIFEKHPKFFPDLAAKEIAEMMTAFIQWIRMPNTLNSNCNNWLTTDALFSYWHTEIYKKELEMKTMFPREFVIWFFDHYKYYNTIQTNDEPLRYGWACDYLPQGTLDEIYQYWRLEIEPKTEEDESK